MKLPVPFVQLPLKFDANLLAAEVQALGEGSWRPHPQGYAGNSMLPLIAVDGDPGNEAFRGAMRATPELRACPYLMQVMGALGATLGRSRLMRLSGHAEVKRHADQGYYWVERVRVHIPIVTQPTVRFQCGEVEVNMAAGECWIFDTWRQHSVVNENDHHRIHLVVDTVGGDRFWEQVDAGRPHPLSEAVSSPWIPRTIAHAPGAEPGLRFETQNLPAVMSPWELDKHLGFLFAEAVPHPQLAAVQALARQFSRQWRGLWAHFGDRPEGRGQFRRAVDAFMAAVRPAASVVALRNDTALFSALMHMVGRVAVAPEPAAPPSVVSHAGRTGQSVR